MLLNQTHLLCPSTKFSCKTLSVFPKVTNFTRTNVGKVATHRNSSSYFPATQHPTPHSDNSAAAGIGISEFFRGKNILITGATGLVGKVLVEKLIRSTSVAKIYLLIKADGDDAVFKRFTTEIINSDLFKSLKEKHGNCYEAFVRNKLIPITGDICELNLGMKFSDTETIRKEVDVIIGSAANTTMNERYDLILESNVNAPQQLMKFAKTCKNLKLFTHMSTAYVNGRREGVISEMPLTFGKNDEMFYSVIGHRDDKELDAANEMNMALQVLSSASTPYDVAKDLKRLGQNRAEYFGWNNVYQLSKAMGEMTLNQIRDNIPLLIMRPSVIESSYKHPFPGWIQGNRMFDPVIISYAKGQLPAYLANPEVYIDIIPVDMVVDTTIAAMAKHGARHDPQVNVYHVASSVVNPFRFSDMFDLLYECFTSEPLLGSDHNLITRMKYFNNFNDFSKYTRHEFSRRCGLKEPLSVDQQTIRKMRNKYKANAAYAEQMCKMYEFVGFFYARFHTGNTLKLLTQMSEQEKLDFEVDATKIDWRKYFLDIHIPGLKKHVINATSV